LEKEVTKVLKKFNSEGIEKVLPDKTCLKDALEVYYRFYSKEQEKKYGVLAIEIKNCNFRRKFIQR
jgi:ASC-1-like (ASCH) protein